MGVLYHTGLKAHVPTLPGAHAQDVLAPVMALAELYWAASSSIIDTIGRKKPSRPKRT